MSVAQDHIDAVLIDLEGPLHSEGVTIGRLPDGRRTLECGDVSATIDPTGVKNRLGALRTVADVFDSVRYAAAPVGGPPPSTS